MAGEKDPGGHKRKVNLLKGKSRIDFLETFIALSPLARKKLKEINGNLTKTKHAKNSYREKTTKLNNSTIQHKVNVKKGQRTVSLNVAIETQKEAAKEAKDAKKSKRKEAPVAIETQKEASKGTKDVKKLNATAALESDRSKKSSDKGDVLDKGGNGTLSKASGLIHSKIEFCFSAQKIW